MKTPICVSHYKNILHITTGNSIQQVDVLFARVRHKGCVGVTKCAPNLIICYTITYYTILLYLLPKPLFVLALQGPGNSHERF